MVFVRQKLRTHRQRVTILCFAIDANAPTICIFARNNKKPSRISLISSNTASNNQFNDYELLTLNGIGDPGHVFTMLDSANTRHFEFSKFRINSQSEISFVAKLNAVSKELHNFLTARYVACTDPASDNVILSRLDFPVIFKFDSDDKFS